MAVEKYAIVDGSTVINLILLDEGNDFTPPEGCLVLPAPEYISLGWQRMLNDWVAPERPAPERPIEDPSDTTAKNDAVKELTDLGISEATARRIIGLPEAD